jgi:hypothetical protein
MNVPDIILDARDAREPEAKKMGFIRSKTGVSTYKWLVNVPKGT